MSNLKKIAVYYRISTKDKQNFESQKFAVEHWLEQNKLKSSFIIEDKESGATENRSGYKQILDLVLRKKIDTVVCYKLDRFGRNARAVIKRIIEIEDLGVRFIAIETPGLNTIESNLPFRMMFLSAFASLAEMERDNIRERIKSGLNAAKKRNVRLGRPSKITEKNQSYALDLKNKGYSIRKVASVMKISQVTVQRLLASSSISL